MSKILVKQGQLLMYQSILHNRTQYFLPKMMGVWLLWALLLCVMTVWHISTGAMDIPMPSVYDAVFNFNVEQFEHHIVMKQRLPRALVAIACGASLGLAGFQAQKLFQNPLVSSSTLGVTSGATFAVVVTMYFFNTTELSLFTPAFVGAFVAGFCTLALTRFLSGSNVSRGLHIVLAGSLVAIAFSSFTTFVVSLDPLLFNGIQGWLLGTIAPSNYQGLQNSFPLFVLGIGVLLIQSKSLDVMMLGEKQASTLGVKTKTINTLTIGGIFLLSALCVAVVGPIGFVGLVVPHIAKLFTREVGYQGAFLSMFIGATALLIADIMARTIIAPKMLLVGAITASVGGVVFLVLLMVRFNKPGGGI